MSDYVVFHRDRIASYSWNKDTKQNEEEDFTMSDLRTRVRIDDEVTLGEIFAAVEKEEGLKSFIAMYSWCQSIDSFHAHARLPRPDAGESEVPLVKIVVSAYGEVFDHRGESDFMVATDLTGYDEKGDRWSISYSPMQQIAHLPVSIDEKFVTRRNYKEDVFVSTRTFSVLEFLDAIYWDISFHGGPEDNEKFLLDMQQQVKDIREGNVELVPLEDVFRDLEQQEN